MLTARPIQPDRDVKVGLPPQIDYLRNQTFTDYSTRDLLDLVGSLAPTLPTFGEVVRFDTLEQALAVARELQDHPDFFDSFRPATYSEICKHSLDNDVWVPDTSFQQPFRMHHGRLMQAPNTPAGYGRLLITR